MSFGIFGLWEGARQFHNLPKQCHQGGTKVQTQESMKDILHLYHDTAIINTEVLGIKINVQSLQQLNIHGIIFHILEGLGIDNLCNLREFS